MKRKILTQIFALGLLLNLAACEIPDTKVLEGENTSETGSTQWLSYAETQCADPWGHCNKDPQKTTCVKEHLESLSVTVLEAKITGTAAQVMCMACTCGTGRVFKVKVKLEDVSKAEAIGFKKI